ncbi:putative OmpA/MotB domain-containing protein [Magnetofaba australis IT-1]|uniref:Putative OmpA/MotB domain-containing protein n=1 Tax=Magnetofaba australis IT-1 TaxID=1434232 RepID=A0A1Y2K4S2_9PROT|nr:putative OmpA/MotB domain-containing protein [Magnetofaba australis IT-1]
MRIATQARRTETADNPFWISYADLMTALVMLFLVVMSISMVAVASRDEARMKEREVQIGEIFDDLEQAGREAKLPLVVDRNAQTIGFGDQAQFGLDSYYLHPQTIESLQAFVPLLLDSQRREAGGKWLKRIHIEGYTDDIGTYLYNVHLSLNRAQAVLCALMSTDVPMEDKRLLQRMIVIDGATTTSVRESREASRRVEIRLEFRTLDDTAPLAPLLNMEMGRCPLPNKPDEVIKEVPPELQKAPDVYKKS